MGDLVAFLAFAAVALGVVVGSAWAAFVLALASVRGVSSRLSDDRRYAARVARGLEDPERPKTPADPKRGQVEALVATWRAAHGSATEEHEEAVRWSYARLLYGVEPEQGSVEDALGYLERFGADVPPGLRT